MDDSKIVSIGIDIDALPAKVWQVITKDTFAKELGEVFDKNAFVESDWKLGSKVHFKYEPDKIVYSGTIGKLIEEALIRIDYDFPGFDYEERYSIEKKDSKSRLSLDAGPYPQDFEAQMKVWSNWLSKVREICDRID